MGLNPHSFGRCLETLLRKARENPERLLDETFREALALASVEWEDTAHQYNGGNDRRRNLHRMGTYIRSIGERCRSPLDRHGRPLEIDWGWIIGDVESISKAVRYDMLHNTLIVDPNPHHNHVGKYMRMPED